MKLIKEKRRSIMECSIKEITNEFRKCHKEDLIRIQIKPRGWTKFLSAQYYTIEGAKE